MVPLTARGLPKAALLQTTICCRSVAAHGSGKADIEFAHRRSSYTCAGGHDGAQLRGKSFFLSMSARRRLLQRAMSYQPDLVIANGDQIYFDLTTTYQEIDAGYLRKEIWEKVGNIDTSIPMIQGANAPIFIQYATDRLRGFTETYCDRRRCSS